MEKWHKNVGFVSVASQVKPAMTIAKDWVVFVKPSFIPVTDRIWCVVDLTLSGRWNRVRVTATEYQIYNSEYHAIIPFRWSFLSRALCRRWKNIRTFEFDRAQRASSFPVFAVWPRTKTIITTTRNVTKKTLVDPHNHSYLDAITFRLKRYRIY